MDKQNMRERTRTLFSSYEQAFNSALQGDVDTDEISTFYADVFIAANPHGVMTGENNETLKERMAEGYKYYRSIGTKHMQCLDVDVTVIDPQHLVAHTKWKASYIVNAQEIQISFHANYLIQFQESEPKIFGWITGDESELLQQYGVI